MISMMEKYILDTNIFFNMEAGLGLGRKTQDVVGKITQFAQKLKESKKAEFIMPPRAIEEFLSFFEEKEQPFIKTFLSSITIKTPDYGALAFSSEVFYKLVKEIRQRSYRGLAIGEEEIVNAVQGMQGKQVQSKKDFQIQVGAFIKTFRDRYRNATRTGFLDSVADLDLIVLAKEQDGVLITTDEGVLHWGRTFGVKEMPAAGFLRRVEELLRPDHRE